MSTFGQDRRMPNKIKTEKNIVTPQHVSANGWQEFHIGKILHFSEQMTLLSVLENYNRLHD